VSFFLTSDFAPGEPIPRRFTCDGEDVSPPLGWGGAPEATQVVALVMDDVDAPDDSPVIHWLLFNLPPEVHELPAAMPRLEWFDVGTVQIPNSFGRIGHSGPCPPSGELHHYRFTLSALDAPLKLGPAAPTRQVLDAIQAHTIDHVQLVGTYRR
jgi:Raf kinase inhibitor-like YbhB/YbcL family protein